MPPKIVVITGPTATGKTRLGIELCLKTGGEVVSADSMQLYRGMDIGTAKPNAEEMRGVPHHMLDVAEPGEDFSVARYVGLASKCVEDILSRGKIPFVVGGTGLYIDSLLRGTVFAAGDNGDVRARLSAQYDRDGGAALYARLAETDPEAAARIHINDRKRVVRALEIQELTGGTITAHDAESRAAEPRFDALKLALTFRDRTELYRRIDARVDAMVASGLVSEVRKLLDSGVPIGSTAMQAIGYKEIAAALYAEQRAENIQRAESAQCGATALEEAIDAVRQGSRRYAKRQLSWLRRDEKLHWIQWENTPDFEKAVQISTELLEYYGIISV